MYKEVERLAVRLMKKGEKACAPDWLMDYCRFAIDKAQFYRRSADDKKACADIEGWRSDRFTKAMNMANHVADVMDAYLRSQKTPNV